jgi:hypothetical protein
MLDGIWEDVALKRNLLFVAAQIALEEINKGNTQRASLILSKALDEVRGYGTAPSAEVENPEIDGR